MPSHRVCPLIVGWREWVGLPDLGIDGIKAKIDTGARTSAIHAWNIVREERGDGPWVRFDLHPLQRNNRIVVACAAPLCDERTVRNSGGHAERRYVVRTRLRLGGETWPIELSLTNRDQMGFRLLLGRTALEGRFRIDPGRSFLLSQREAAAAGSRRRR